MENKKRVQAEIKWYDNEKGFGLASSSEGVLLVFGAYLINKEELMTGDIISCEIFNEKGMLHATKALLEKKNELEDKQVLKK